ncbi:hypothetical protein HY484_02175 [Candidatus Woesearchaeota archaeon]|nr:hypothetical protein [Candidatus Woesearchaeota archaeon]
MSSSKFVETARRIIRERPEVFEALMEFERTKRLPKTSYRERINLTIDSFLLRKFKRYCQGRNLNMSRLIEKHMKEELNLK